jgi:Leucine-rich repeat (LRR) protein
MPLEYTQPSEELARDLREVARDAVALMNALTWTTNAEIPSDFPRNELIQIAQSLASLPVGTAEGSRAQLEYARDRLPALRDEHIVSEELDAPSSDPDASPPLLRGAVVDQALIKLIGSVTTARARYWRLVKQPIEELVPEAAVSASKGFASDALKKSLELERGLSGAKTAVEKTTRPESEPADNLKRQLSDAVGLNRLARVELRMPTIVVGWYRRTVEALKEYPTLIRKTAESLKLGADVAEIAFERWHDFERNMSSFLVREFKETCDSFISMATILDERRRRGSGSRNSELPYDFDLARAREMILAGDPPPMSWWQYIEELDFSSAPLNDISPLTVLTNLRRLQLAATPAADFSPLVQLENLQSLNLASTRLSDVAWVTGLEALQSLNLSRTGVQNITPIKHLHYLQSLDLSFTVVSNIAGLESLRNLRTLNLSNLSIRNISALSHLRNLENLDLSRTQVSDLASLSNLRNLEVLDLGATQVTATSGLERLVALKRLSLSGTKVQEISALGGLRDLQYLSIRGTRVVDVHALENLTRLQSLLLGGTRVREIRALANLRALKDLSLNGTRVTDISALAGLGALQNLRLGSTEIKDIQALTDLKNLETLDISDTPVDDVTPLFGHYKMKALDIRSTGVTSVASLRDIADIQIRRGRLRGRRRRLRRITK